MIFIAHKGLRNSLRWLIPLLLIPLTVWTGAILLSPRQYWLVMLIVAVLSLVLFSTGFDQKKVGARRMVIVAILIALSVVGRLLPFFKPITAITVIAALYLGSEVGFLVGALSALLSNFLFGQGPWTPFQMLAWGMIGLLAGILRSPLLKSRLLLLAYGILSGILYSLVMDLWVMLSAEGNAGWAVYLGTVIASLPHTLLYALSNFVFLWFLAKPFGDKLTRIRVKYGI